MEFEIEGGLKVKVINEIDKSASISGSPTATGNIFIPSFYEKDNQKYKIISIESHAFTECNIDTLTFLEDSEIEIFESQCFYGAKIKKLQIPAKVKTIDGCFIHINDLREIEISPNNHNFILHNNQLLLGKSNNETNKFDILHFAMFDVENVQIPSEISIITQYSFYSHQNLKTVTFNSNSELKLIGANSFSFTNITNLTFPASVEELETNSFSNTLSLKTVQFPNDSKLKKVTKAFNNSNIESIFLPASVEFIDSECFSFTPNLQEIKISSENKFFKEIDDNFIVNESVKGSGVFDSILIARRNIESIQIPFYIKIINCFAFHECQCRKSIFFNINSLLENIQDYAFCSISSKILVLPPSLKEVGVHSFSQNKKLQILEFTSHIITIKDSFLDGCVNLSMVSFKNANQIIIEKDAMKGIPSNTEIYMKRSVQLSGDGLEDIKSQIRYIKEEEEDKRMIIQEEKNKRMIILEKLNEEVTQILQENQKIKFIYDKFNQNIVDHYEKENFPQDDIIKESIQKKPYFDFLPSLLLHFSKSPKDIDYDKLQIFLGEDAVILDVNNVQAVSTMIRVSLLSVDKFDQQFIQYMLNEYITNLKENITLPKYQNFIGNFINEPEICIPNDDEIQKAINRPPFNDLHNFLYFNETEINKIRKVFLQSLIKDKEKYNLKFIFNYNDLYNQIDNKIREDLRINQYEMFMDNQIIMFPSKFMNEYENIKKHINTNDTVECFLYCDTKNVLKQDAWFGEGDYLTDNLFYAAYLSNTSKEKLCSVLGINQTTNIICCRVVYNKSYVRIVTDFSYSRKSVDECVKNNYGINVAFVGCNAGFTPINPNDKDKNEISAHEFVIPNKFQIIPLCLFSITRKDYYILWKDENVTNKENTKYLNELTSMSKNMEINLYIKNNNMDALKLIENKKYARVKLITTGGHDLNDKKFIEEARKKIKSNFVCLVFSNDLANMQWISKMENVLFTMYFNDVKTFAELEMNLENVLNFEKSLRQKFEHMFKSQRLKLWKINTDQLLHFPILDDPKKNL